MATYSLTADHRGHGWYHSWLLKTGSWDDGGWWADVAAWEPNEGINFGIGEAAGTGTFSLTGQAVNEQITHLFGAGSFTLNGQDAFRSVSEAAGAGIFTVNGQAITEDISVAHAPGSFALSGQDAGKDIVHLFGAGSFSLAGQAAFRNVIEAAGTGIFVFNGVPITKAYSERVDEGTFALVGQNVAKGVLELAEAFGVYVCSHSWLLRSGFWDDGGWWADHMAWEANRDINFGISELAGTGVFVLTGEDAFKKLVERIDVGLFTLTMQDVLVWKPRYEFQDYKPVAELFNAGRNSATVLDEINAVELFDEQNEAEVMDEINILELLGERNEAA